MTEKSSDQTEKPKTTLPGTVEKIVKPPHPSMPEKAQISVEGADDLYREIRIENVLKDEDGERLALSRARSRSHHEADPEHTTKKRTSFADVYRSEMQLFGDSGSLKHVCPPTAGKIQD